MKRLLTIALAAVLLIALAACKVSSTSTSTTTITTSVTDEDGNTKTNTVTNEIGVSAGTDGIQVTNETTTSDETTTADETTPSESEEQAAYPPAEDLYDLFSEGAEGVDDDGESFYFAYDGPDMKYALLVMVSADKSECHVRNGEVIWYDETNSSALYDEELDVLIPFEISASEKNGAFVMTFLADGDVVTMRFVDRDVIIRDIQDVLSNYTFE